ncbi:hypothetical protein B738_26727 [Photorhabdus temperata subsp. temperata M1021]|nr:hypothetical protein B738_26727 [Photorhabdus temperata subsp. temperata M1021]
MIAFLQKLSAQYKNGHMFISFQRGYVEYQAQAAGIQVKYVNLAYSSKTYSRSYTGS